MLRAWYGPRAWCLRVPGSGFGQTSFEDSKHSSDALRHLDQPLVVLAGQNPRPWRHAAAPRLSVRTCRDRVNCANSLLRPLTNPSAIFMPHGQRGGIELTAEGKVPLEAGTLNHAANLVAELLRELPHAQVLKASDAHEAPRNARWVPPHEPRTRTTKFLVPIPNQAPSTKHQAPAPAPPKRGIQPRPR